MTPSGIVSGRRTFTSMTEIVTTIGTEAGIGCVTGLVVGNTYLDYKQGEHLENAFRSNSQPSRQLLTRTISNTTRN
jgi:hypothetical protein